MYFNVRFHNTHSLHNSSRSGAGKRGGEHKCTSVSNPFTGRKSLGNIFFSLTLMPAPEFEASIIQFYPLHLSGVYCFLNNVMKHVTSVMGGLKDCYFYLKAQTLYI